MTHVLNFAAETLPFWRPFAVVALLMLLVVAVDYFWESR